MFIVVSSELIISAWMTEPGVDSGDRLAKPPVHHSEPASSPSPATKTTRIRFLDQLSPDAQKAYHDEQERRREEKKNKIEEVGESETRIERVEQPPASMLASQTAENTQYNRQHTRDTAVVSSAPGGEAEGLTNGHQEQEPGPGPPQPAQGPSEPGAQAPRFVDIQTRYREQVSTPGRLASSISNMISSSGTDHPEPPVSGSRHGR